MKDIVTTSFDEVINSFDRLFFWTKDSEEETSYSENVLNVTGYSSGEINNLQNGWHYLIVKEDLPEYKKQLAKFESDNDSQSVTIEYHINQKNGELICVSEKIRIYRDLDGKILRYVGMVTDITQIKNDFNKLSERIEDLEQLNSSKDSFLSILSHDLRAPFTSILGFSEILLNEAGVSEKEKVEYLKYINESSQNQLQLINYLLDWSRLQTGRLKIEPQRLHAQSVVYNCVSGLTGMAVRKNVNIKVNIPETIYIEADDRLIIQVITNIISNAIKFSNENDTVEVSASVFNKVFIEFIVKDEGTGIPETNKEKIFHIGKIFSTEGTKGEKGTGLGLALAKQIVEKHGGDIWFYSDERKGSEFHFTVQSSSNTILIVKQNSEQRKEFQKILSELYSTFDILAAENGFEALGIISAKMPSLIISDHDLPLMDGIQLVQSVRKEYKNLRIPFIALLGPDSDSIKKLYQEIGIKTLCSKPVDFDKLSEKIQSLLW